MVVRLQELTQARKTRKTNAEKPEKDKSTKEADEKHKAAEQADQRSIALIDQAKRTRCFSAPWRPAGHPDIQALDTAKELSDEIAKSTTIFDKPFIVKASGIDLSTSNT
jgi:hypothetical protein